MSGHNKPKNVRRSKQFWDAAEPILIDIWAQFEGELRMPKKNSHVYAEMAAQMQGYSYDVTGEEVNTKIKNLRSKFRNYKNKVGPSGGAPSQWRHYVEVNKIIGTYPVNNAKNLVHDTLAVESDEDKYIVEMLDDSIQFDEEEEHESQLSLSTADTPASSKASSSKRTKKNNTMDKAFDAITKCANRLEASIKEHDERSKRREQENTKVFNASLLFLEKSTNLINTIEGNLKK